MRGRWIVAVLAVAVSAAALLVTSALADLRSPSGTAELGASLAEDPAVQALVAAAVVDAIIDDAVVRSPAVGALAPLIRPILARAAETTVASPAGRAALTTALTDAIRQLTLRGPIVIDLRAAASAAAGQAPPPLDVLARAAVAQGTIGLVVIGSDGTVATGEAAAATPTLTGDVGGVPGGAARAAVALVLLLVLVALIVPQPTRRPRLLAAGATLAVIGAVAALMLRLAPDLLVRSIMEDPDRAEGPLAAVLPTLTEGLAALLGRTGAISLALLAVGLALVAAGLLSGSSGSSAEAHQG
jgi:hypothetical protein